MKCLSPITINRSTSEEAVVACGQCIACRITKTEEWALRIVHEFMTSDYGVFLTLTYDDKCVPVSDKTGQLSLCKRHVQLFLKKIRKSKKIRYFISGEYGEETRRPHYHAIIFGLHKIEDKLLIENCWKHGFVSFGNITYKSAKYTAKYIQKRLTGQAAAEYKIFDIEPEFALMSRRPGIGNDACKKYLDKWCLKGYINIDGVDRQIPRYYLTKLTEIQKKRLKLKLLADNYKKFERMIHEVDYFKLAREEKNKMKIKYDIKADENIESQIQRERDIIQKLNLRRKKL